MTKKKPTSAVAGVANVVKRINATLATLERNVKVTVTTERTSGGTAHEAGSGDSVLSLARSRGSR